jgi:hypothetical protein
MPHLERGYVVPAWVMLGGWCAGWLHRNGREAVADALRTMPFPLRHGWHPRDPNRADEGDRPDLVEAHQ